MASPQEPFIHPARSAMIRETRSPSAQPSEGPEEQFSDVIHGAPVERDQGAEIVLDLQAFRPCDPAKYLRAFSIANLGGEINKEFFDLELDPTNAAPDTNARGNQEFHTCDAIEYSRAIARATINNVLYEDYFDSIVKHISWNLQEVPSPPQHLPLTLRQSTEPRNQFRHARSTHTPAPPVPQPLHPRLSSSALPPGVQIDHESAQLPVQESIEPGSQESQAQQVAGPLDAHQSSRNNDSNSRRSRSPDRPRRRAPLNRDFARKNHASGRRRGDSRDRHDRSDRDLGRRQYRSRDYAARAHSSANQVSEGPPRRPPVLTASEPLQDGSRREEAVHHGEHTSVLNTDPAAVSVKPEFGVEAHFSPSKLQQQVEASNRRTAQLLNKPYIESAISPNSGPSPELELPNSEHSSLGFKKEAVDGGDDGGTQLNDKTVADHSLMPAAQRPLAPSAIEAWQEKNKASVCVDCWLRGLECDSQTTCGQCVEHGRPCSYVCCPVHNCKGVRCPAYHPWRGDEKKRVVGCNLHLVALLKLRPTCSPSHDVRRIKELFDGPDTAQAIHSRISTPIQEAEAKGRKIDSVLVKELIVEHGAYHTLQHRALLPKVNMIVTFVSEMKQSRYQEIYKSEKRLIKFGR